MAPGVVDSNVTADSIGKPGGAAVLDAMEPRLSFKGDHGEEAMKNLTVKEEEALTHHTVKEEDRPTVAHDEWWEDAQIPVIDLSLVETDKAGVLKQLHDAAAEWGFFQIVNHGLSLEALRAMEAQGKKFFGLPAEVKAKAPLYTGFDAKNSASSLLWAESVWISTEGVDKTIDPVWPDGNAEFRDAVINFFTGAEAINRQLMELLAESLGLKTDFFSKHLNSRRTLATRWNHYLACPQPSQTLGAKSHTDGCALTLLQQDKAGGLQVQKGDRWIAVKPVEGALVVNIGDTLHAWTNGRYRSVFHRAVVNKSVNRLSLAAFFNVDKELSISAPEELIDASHPRLYRPFTFADYLMLIMDTRAKSETVSRNGYHILDGFAKAEAEK